MDSGEADRMVVLLTKEHGKVRAVARGMRKPQAKRTAGLDLFAISRVQLIPGKSDIFTVGEVAKAPEWPAPMAAGGMELIRVYAQGAVCEMIDRLTETAQGLGIEIFNLVAGSLQLCREGGVDPVLSVTWCGRMLLEKMGFGAEVGNCVGCGETLKPVPARFVAEEGGFLCESCSGREGILCGVSTIKMMRLAHAKAQKTFFGIRLNQSIRKEMLGVLQSEIEAHSYRRLLAFPELCKLI